MIQKQQKEVKDTNQEIKKITLSNLLTTTFEKQEEVNGHRLNGKQSKQTIKMMFDTKIASNLLFQKPKTIKSLYKKPCVFKHKW